MPIVHSPDYPDIDGPLVFLAGPIFGAPDWQPGAERLFHAQRPDLWLANPRPTLTTDDDRQIDWESHHLSRAGDEGVVFFWCPNEETHDCSRPYGQTTRFELGEWVARSKAAGSNLVLGVEPGFSNAYYFRRRLARDLPHAPVRDTLEATVEATLGLLD